VIPPRHAVLTAVPPVPPMPWCVEYLAPHAPGAKLGKAVASVDHVAMMVVQGSSPEEVEARLLELDAWFAGETRWKEPDDVGSAA
jgi:hypothetical protein